MSQLLLRGRCLLLANHRNGNATLNKPASMMMTMKMILRRRRGDLTKKLKCDDRRRFSSNKVVGIVDAINKQQARQGEEMQKETVQQQPKIVVIEQRILDGLIEGESQQRNAGVIDRKGAFEVLVEGKSQQGCVGRFKEGARLVEEKSQQPKIGLNRKGTLIQLGQQRSEQESHQSSRGRFKERELNALLEQPKVAVLEQPEAHALPTEKPNTDVNIKKQPLASKLCSMAPPGAQPYLQLMRLDRPTGTWLLYWPCGWGIASAAVNTGHHPDLAMLALFLAGAVVMRGAGCTINDMWDREIDARVARTAERPLASGRITNRNALFFLAAQLTTGLAILCQLNTYSIVLGASSMLLVITYPLMKRYTDWPQLVLGFAFNWGALLGYAACLGHLDLGVCLPLYAAGVCWTIVYDTIYAHQDREEDRAIGIKSTALRFGGLQETRLWLGGFGATMLACLAASGVGQGQTWPYYVGVGVVGAHLAAQLATLDVDDAGNCGRRFAANKHVGWIVFAGIVLGNFLLVVEGEEGANSGDVMEVSTSTNAATTTTISNSANDDDSSNNNVTFLAAREVAEKAPSPAGLSKKL